MKPTRSLRHNASVRSVASTSVSRHHQHSSSGGADKAYDTVLSKAAAKHAFELSIASSSVRENGNTRGGLNRASSTSSGKRQERMALSRGFSTRTESYRRSVQCEAGLARSQTVGPSSTLVPIGGRECKNHRTTLGQTALARSASAGASSLVRARSVQSFESRGVSRSATMTSRYSTISIGSTPAATRRDSFLRGGDEFAEVEYRNNPRLRKKHEKKLAAAVKKAEKTEKAEKRETGSDRGGHAFIKGVKKMFSFASSNTKNGGAQREVADEDERGTYTVLTTTSKFTSPRSNVESHTPIPPQQVSSRQAYYRPASQVGYAFSRRTSFAQSMRGVLVDDDGASVDVNVPAPGVLKDKTNSNQEAWMTSRMSSYTSTDPFLSAVARETPSPPPLPSTQPLRRKSSLLRKPLARHLTPDRVYSAIMRRIQSRDADTVSRVSPLTAETPATTMQRQQHTVPRSSPLTQCNLTDLNMNEIAARQLSESSDMSFNFSISTRDLRKEPNAFSTIRIVNAGLRATAASAFEPQHPTTVTTENTSSPNPLGRPDGLNRFCSTASNGSVATALPPSSTEIKAPLAVTPQNTGDTAASWASANPFRSHTRPLEISSLFPYYGVTRQATSMATSETTPLRFHQWQYGNVPDSPQALHINHSEDTVIFRGGTASIRSSRVASEVSRAGENEQAARIVEMTLRDSISDAVDMQFGAAW
ncbi:uncharacterized protein V1513DRAFT_30525 [Lipomyces chichibuensis]|uniref:uncharacterized protein n=1 Tax=Lipomyces chichibuensis TaxID=1546026 RepID=UPI00334300C8